MSGIVGISISDSPDLQRLGFSKAHLDQALVEIVTQLAVSGYRLSYGGDLRPGGFTNKIIFAAAETYGNANIATDTPPIVHHVPGPVWKNWSAEALVRHVTTLAGTGEVVLILDASTGVAFRISDSTDKQARDFQQIQKLIIKKRKPVHFQLTTCQRLRAWSVRLGVPEGGADRSTDLEPKLPSDLDLTPWNAGSNKTDHDASDGDAPTNSARSMLEIVETCLAEMRKRIHDETAAYGFSIARHFMAMDNDVRIVLGGQTKDSKGDVSGYKGNAPGIAEEALYALMAGCPVLALGTFGGAARGVLRALNGEEAAMVGRGWGDGSVAVLAGLQEAGRQVYNFLKATEAESILDQLGTTDQLRDLAILTRQAVNSLAENKKRALLRVDIG